MEFSLYTFAEMKSHSRRKVRSNDNRNVITFQKPEENKNINIHGRIQPERRLTLLYLAKFCLRVYKDESFAAVLKNFVSSSHFKLGCNI